MPCSIREGDRPHDQEVLRKMSKSLRRLSAGLAVALAAATAVAATSGADAVKSRIDYMKGLGGAAKALIEQQRSGASDPAVVKVEEAKVAAAAQAIPTWFPKGSGPEAGVKTRALPAIWSDAPGFSAAQQ